MLVSNVFVKKKNFTERYVPWLFLLLVLCFTIMGQTKPVVGLVGLGTTLIVAAVLVEVNRVYIWDSYCKAYRKQKGFKGLLTKPNKIYYTINVVFLWPFMAFLGVLSLFIAYDVA